VQRLIKSQSSGSWPEFDVITQHPPADVTDERGWVILELEGDHDEIERGLDWVREQGVRVIPVYEDVVEDDRGTNNVCNCANTHASAQTDQRVGHRRRWR